MKLCGAADRFSDRRCERKRGHDGPHRRDGVSWYLTRSADQPAAGPDAPPGSSTVEARMQAVNDVLEELARCERKHDPFHSAHEGYAVLLEEVDELWDEIKKKLKDYDFKAMRGEAVQVAAQALRFILDIADPAKQQPD